MSLKEEKDILRQIQKLSRAKLVLDDFLKVDTQIAEQKVSRKKSPTSV